MFDKCFNYKGYVIAYVDKKYARNSKNSGDFWLQY